MDENQKPPESPQPDQAPNIEPPSQQPTGQKVIQPSEALVKELEAQKQQSAAQPNTSAANAHHSSANTTHSEPAKSIDQNNLSAGQQIALASTEMRSKESNRPVSLRVKSLLVVAALSLWAAAYGLFRALSISDSGSLITVVAIINLIQLGISVYLFIGRDHHTVSLILKIYLVLQLISLFFSLANPAGFITNGVVALFLFYVYTRVKSLTYY